MDTRFCVHCIVVHGDVIVPCLRVKTGKVWNAHDLRMRASLRHTDKVRAAAVDHDRVVTATQDGFMSVHANEHGHALRFVDRILLVCIDALSLLTTTP